MPAPERGPVHELLARAVAVAARYDAAIRAHHTCTEMLLRRADGGPCLACAEYDERLLEIERQERNRERTR